ncbi:hypothetical protein ACFL7M_11015 [Thermodesulfobacteriota bacterium]
MNSPARLGGFKILKGMAGFSLLLPQVPDNLPILFCRSIADKKINLPYITCVRVDQAWSLNITVDTDNGLRTSLLIEENSGKLFDQASESGILSIFPHNKNPDIVGRLFEVFGRKGVRPDAMANSPSAISVVLKDKYLSMAGDALFEPFIFSAYRTPDDWRLAQRGKEQLYKEVVASYQEQRPKVYGLEYYHDQALVQFKISDKDISPVGGAFKELAREGMDLTFSVTGPSGKERKKLLSFCLPVSEHSGYKKTLNKVFSESSVEIISPVTVFSMNGPHFGDRYGIVSELLTAFERSSIDLLCLSCTIATITGVIPSAQFESAVLAIRSCFEVPSIIEK